MTVTAESMDAARRTVADRLGVAPAYWQGDDPPLALMVALTDPPPGGSSPLRTRPPLVRERRGEPRDARVGAGAISGAWSSLVDALVHPDRRISWTS
jgi:hypothetical protein